MAERAVAQTEAQFNSKFRLPPDRYTIRCIDETFETSSKGNMMIVREWEVVYPESIEINGQKVSLAGAKCKKQYFPTLVFDGKERDAEASDKALARLKAEDAKLGIEYETINDENPALQCKKLIAEAVLRPEEYSRLKDPTAEQRAQGKMGDPILDEDGKPLISFSIVIGEILRKSTREINRPF